MGEPKRFEVSDPQSDTTKKGRSLTMEVVTAAVGVGAFGLASTVGVFGIVGYLVVFILVGWTTFRVSSWWSGHKATWNVRDRSGQLGEYNQYELETFEDYGTLICPGCGKAFLGFVQFFQLSLLCVVFYILLGARLKEFIGVATELGKPELPTVINFKGAKDQLIEGSTFLVHPKVTKFISNPGKSVLGAKLNNWKGMTINKGQVGSIHQDTVTAQIIWKANSEVEVGDAWLRVNDGYYIQAKDAKYSLAKTGGADLAANWVAIGLVIAAAVFQPIPAVDKLLGIMGLVGVVLSWTFIICKMFMFATTTQSEPTTTQSKPIWWKLPIEPDGTTLSSDGFFGNLQEVVENLSKILVGAISAFGVSNLVPQLSKPVKLKNINKALAVGFIIIFAIYLLPVGIYMLKGQNANALEFISSEDKELKLAFELAVCANMIASFALAGQGPAAQLRDLAKRQQTTEKSEMGEKLETTEKSEMVETLEKMLFRFIAAILQVGFAQLIPEGDFFNYLTLFMSFCAPVIAIIVPMIANWKIKEIVGDLYKDPQHWVEIPILWTMFVLAFVSIPFGAWKSWKAISASWIEEGLMKTSITEIAFA